MEAKYNGKFYKVIEDNEDGYLTIQSIIEIVHVPIEAIEVKCELCGKWTTYDNVEWHEDKFLCKDSCFEMMSKEFNVMERMYYGRY